MFTSLLNKKINILARTTSQDSSGQVSESWAVLYSQVPTRFSEAPKNYAISDNNYKDTKETFIFFIDLDYLVTKENRISFEGKEYYIVKVSNFQGNTYQHHQEIYAQIVSIGGQAGMQTGASFNIDDYVPKTRTINGKPLSTDISLDKSDIGLGNVDNTSDLDKPVSKQTANELADKQDIGTNYDDKTYSQAFTNVSSVVVEHNLNKYPSVQIIDNAGNEIIGDIVFTSLNSLTITFSENITGTVYLN